MTNIVKPLTFLAIALSSRPATAQVNAYSLIEPPLPGSGIAQGAIFTMPVGLTGAPTISQNVPLKKELGGVTIHVTVGDVTTQAIPYYVSDGQVMAILPSSTPVGSGTISVESGGLTVLGSSIQVIASAFGILTQPGGGAAARNNNQNGQLLDQTSAANPGESITLWGTGLGAVSGDETQYQTPADLTDRPIEVEIGDLSSAITYHGRSIYPGVDQINVIVPEGVSGCFVSVVVIAGGVPSNSATIPVASSGRTCSDPEIVPITPEQYQKLLSLDNVSVGTITLRKWTPTDPDMFFEPPDYAYAYFARIPVQQFSPLGLLQRASLGSCLVSYALPPITPVYALETSGSLSDGMNAGPQINLTGPYGWLPLSRAIHGFYLGLGPYFPSEGPAIIPSAGGTFTFDNGSGGPDLGPFNINLTADLNASPLLWTNQSAITALERAKGQTFTWTGGAPGSNVYILGYSFAHVPSSGRNGANKYVVYVDGTNEYVYFTCSAPVSAGKFTVPAAVLSSLPPSTTCSDFELLHQTCSPTGYLYVANTTVQQFSASGLDLGLLSFTVGNGISVPFN